MIEHVYDMGEINMDKKGKNCNEYRKYKNIVAAWGPGTKRVTLVGIVALIFSIIGLLLGSNYVVSIAFNVVAIVLAIWDIRRPMHEEVFDIVAIGFASVSIITVSLYLLGIARFIPTFEQKAVGVLGFISMAEFVLGIICWLMCIIVLVNPKFAIIPQIKNKRAKAVLTWFTIGLVAITIHILTNSIHII